VTNQVLDRLSNDFPSKSPSKSQSEPPPEPIDIGESKTGPRWAWATHNYERSLKDLVEKAEHNAAAYLVVNILVIGGGFAISGLAVASKGSNGSGASWFVFGIGLVVAVAGGLSQQFRFGFRSSERRTLVLAFPPLGRPSLIRPRSGAASHRPDRRHR
jgi:hypothetical protein